MRKIYFLFFILILSCAKNEIPNYFLSVKANPGGSVNTAGGEFAEGKSISITAIPDAEYEFVN